MIHNQAALWAPHLKQLGPICALKQTDFGYLRRRKLELKCFPWLRHLGGLSPLWNLLWFVLSSDTEILMEKPTGSFHLLVYFSSLEEDRSCELFATLLKESKRLKIVGE